MFQEDNPPVIEFSVSASSYNDRTFIQFVDTAKFEYDIADAPKLANSIFNLATMTSDSVNLSINVLSGGACAFDVPVDLSNTWDDAYSIYWNVSPELLDLYKMSLKDLFTSEVYDINSGAVGFDFDISSDPQTKQKNRFILHFETKSINTELLVDGVQNCENKNIARIIINDSQLGVDYDIWSTNTLLTTISGIGNDISYEVDSIYLTSDTNLFNIKSHRPACPGQEVETNLSLEMISTPVIEYNADMNLLVNSNGTAGYWYNNNELLSSEPSSSYEPDQILGGNYIVEVINNGCSFISDAFVVTDISLDELVSNISLSPNPANDFIEIHSNNEDVANSTIRVVDVNGKLYYSGELNQANTKINVSDFTRGVYIVIIDNNARSQRIRFIKL